MGRTQPTTRAAIGPAVAAVLLPPLLAGCEPGGLGTVDSGSTDSGAGDGAAPDDAPAPPDASGRDAASAPDARRARDGAPATDGGSGGDGPPPNRFGMGLVNPGSTADLDRVADLVGPGGHVKLIFAGITRETRGPSADWVRAVREAYERDLVPVIRMGPPWGDLFVRDQSDDAAHRDYTSLAAAYRRVVEGLPLRRDWPLWVEVHNETNLCNEWRCAAGTGDGSGWLGYQQAAAEYASMLRDVADAVHAMGDPRIKVINGGLAPGGTRRCECGGDGYEAGITSIEYIGAMRAAVPGVMDELDGWASHSYPATGAGFGFFAPYDDSATGLRYFQQELSAIGRDVPVLVTETGWCADTGSGCPDQGGGNTRSEQASWTVAAWNDPWLAHPDIRAVMPFQLRDGNWDHFGWVAVDGTPYPVYGEVRALRCSMISGRCP